MTASERFDRDFADLLAELAQPEPPDYFDEALQLAVSHHQRPAWTFPERWIPMGVLTRRLPLVPALPSRTIGLLVMLLLLLLATVVIGVGALLLQQQQRPAPPFGLAANGAFAYSQDGDIHSVEPDGGQARLVIGGPTIDFAPGYSRDGRTLYFIRAVSQGPDVVAVMAANADGSGVRTVVEPEESSGRHWWTLSPKGDVIVMSNESVSPRFSIISLADGTRTAPELPVEVLVHDWLPTGDEILLVGGTPTGQTGIHAVQPDGRGFRTIVEPRVAHSIMSLFISDDGRYVAYSVRVGGVRAWSLLELATGVDTVQPAPVGEQQEFSAFSPDTSRIAFVRYSDEQGGRSTAQVVVSPLDSPSTVVAVGPRQRVPTGTTGLSAQFSPDATGLVITSDDGNAWLVDLATGEYEALPFGNESGVSWQRQAP